MVNPNEFKVDPAHPTVRVALVNDPAQRRALMLESGLAIIAANASARADYERENHLFSMRGLDKSLLFMRTGAETDAGPKEYLFLVTGGTVEERSHVVQDAADRFNNWSKLHEKK